SRAGEPIRAVLSGVASPAQEGDTIGSLTDPPSPNAPSPCVSGRIKRSERRRAPKREAWCAIPVPNFSNRRRDVGFLQETPRSVCARDASAVPASKLSRTSKPDTLPGHAAPRRCPVEVADVLPDSVLLL